MWGVGVQNTLRLLKEECLAYDARSRAIVSALEGLLEEESDMSLMCLTRLHFDLAYVLPSTIWQKRTQVHAMHHTAVHVSECADTCCHCTAIICMGQTSHTRR